MDIKQVNDEYKMASDINKDGEINTGDSFLLKKYIMEVQNISI